MIARPRSEVTEEAIRLLVDRFYARIRRDATLRPVFAAAIADDAWPAHLEKMYAFWSSVMLTSGRYKGDPVSVHRAVAGIEPPKFGNWLDIFEATARELFSPALATAFVDKAKRIAESLKLGLAFHSPTPEIWAELPPRAIPQTTLR